MKSSKLIDLLKALESDEFRQFYRYLKSPFFTKSAEVIQLYEYLRKFYPQFDSPKLERQTVFTALYPKEKFNGPRLRNLILKITKILEEYLIYLEYQQNDFQKKKMLTHIYGKRNLNVFFRQKTEELLDDLEQQSYRDTDYFYEAYLLQRDYYFHSSISKEGKIVEKLKSSLSKLNSFYSIERLRLGIDLVNRNKIFGEEHQFSTHDLSGIHPSENLIYHLLLQVINLLKTGEESLFFEAKRSFQKNAVLINQIDAGIILPALLNYAIQQFPKNEKRFSREAFELYKIGLDKAVFVQDNYFLNTTFLNIVVIGSKLKEFEWVQAFIKKYQPQLRESIREDLTKLSLGFLFFNKLDYHQIPDLLQNYQFQNTLYKINAKTLLIRSYYQLFEQDKTLGNMIISNCNAFERYIKRERSISQEKKESYLNFSFILKKIISRKLRHPNFKEKDLSYLLNNFSTVFAKTWLQDIIGVQL